MQWPWVNRSRLILLDLQFEGEQRRAVIAEERVRHLQEALERSETERRETFLRLLRLAQGLPIFPDAINAVKEETPEETARVLDFAGLTEHEIDDALTRVAVDMGMRTLPAVQRFIEQQKTRYYREHDRAKMSREDEQLREQAVRSMNEALQQGAAAAQRSN